MSEELLIPNYLKQYVKEKGEQSKADIYNILIERVENEDTIADNYGKLTFSERFEFQFDELIRSLNEIPNDNYLEIIKIIHDSSIILDITIDNFEDEENKRIYQELAKQRYLDILNIYQPNLDIQVDGYKGLDAKEYEDGKTAYLRAVGQLLDAIGHKNKSYRVAVVNAFKKKFGDKYK